MPWKRPEARHNKPSIPPTSIRGPRRSSLLPKSSIPRTSFSRLNRGSAHDDTNITILVSNLAFDSTIITTPVQTSRVAPTILQALGLDPANCKL